MRVSVSGVGIWARGLTSWGSFVDGVRQGFAAPEAMFEKPAPAAMPARERRRASMIINLAVEVVHQACDMAGVDKSRIASVFTSAMSDSEVTDYMCRKLTTEDRLLSPAKFHNSVHNAAAGHFSISAENRAASTYVAAFRDSVGVAILEAATQAASTDAPVVMAAYDVAAPAPFEDICPIGETLAVALVLDGGAETPGRRLTLECVAGRREATAPRSGHLCELARRNPIGTSLALLEALGADAPARLVLPIGRELSLALEVA